MAKENKNEKVFFHDCLLCASIHGFIYSLCYTFLLIFQYSFIHFCVKLFILLCTCTCAAINCVANKMKELRNIPIKFLLQLSHVF